MNKLSNSMERLGMYQPTESPSTITEKKDLQLKKTRRGKNKPVEHHNTTVTIRKIYREIQ